MAIINRYVAAIRVWREYENDGEDADLRHHFKKGKLVRSCEDFLCLRSAFRLRTAAIKEYAAALMQKVEESFDLPYSENWQKILTAEMKGQDTTEYMVRNSKWRVLEDPLGSPPDPADFPLTIIKAEDRRPPYTY